MRRLTESDLATIIGNTVEGYHVEAARIKDGPCTDSDHYGFILGKNDRGHYVTWRFHLLDDGSVSVYWGHYFMGDQDAAIRDFYDRDKTFYTSEFKVVITETLRRTVEVEPGSHWYAGSIVIFKHLGSDK